MPDDQAEITAELIRELLEDQHPDLADRPVSFGARGWDNQLWRLGDDLAVRLPWATPAADALLLKEYAWLPGLAPRLPVPVPLPLRLGQPSPRFPRVWIVTTWVPGEPADRAPVSASSAAGALAGFLSALHRPAPSGVPCGRGRGGALAPFADGVARQLAAFSDAGLVPDGERVREVWQDALAAPGWTGPRMWLHGDLHPANVLTDHGQICGVVDFGDLCAGDPACDLAAAWILLPDVDAINRFRAAYAGPADPGIWRRARGWAIWRAMGCLDIAEAGKRGDPGGKPSWGPPALASLRRLAAA